MAYAYFDTSALIKRYVEEPGRREVLGLLRKNACVVSGVLPVEVRSALRRRVAENTLGANGVARVVKRLAADRSFWIVIDVVREVLATADVLSGTHQLRALDAIHVASARLFATRLGSSSTFTFVSADVRQIRAADALGLTTRHIES